MWSEEALVLHEAMRRCHFLLKADSMSGPSGEPGLTDRLVFLGLVAREP